MAAAKPQSVTTTLNIDFSEPGSLTNAGVKVLRVVHSDLFGRQRGKQFPVSYSQQLTHGVSYSKMSISEDLLGVPVDETAFPQVAGHPDILARIEPGNVVVPPWEPDSVWILAGLFEPDGTRSLLCARGALMSALDALKSQLGLTAISAAEPEFYLFKNSSGAQISEPYGTQGVSYTMDRITDPEGAIGRIHRQLIEMGIGVTVVNREFSPGQFEINLQHTHALRSADQVFLLKTALKELAIQEGLHANFMPKPISGEEGSGLHVHMSLWNDAGVNVFEAEDGNLSDTLLSAIAGVQLHAPALLAFAAPTINSYKRLRGNGLSPRTSNWAEDNRFTFLRIPPERGSATRFEMRAGDASASPHLLSAAIIWAAIDGIQRKLTPDSVGQQLPTSLEASLHALEANDYITSVMSRELVDVFAAIKRAEIASYESTVTDWEWSLYNSNA